MTLLVLRAEEEKVRLGGAANVACLLRHLAARVTLAGVVGDDPGGRTVRRLMDEIQIRGDGVLIDPARCTTTRERLVGRAARAVSCRHVFSSRFREANRWTLLRMKENWATAPVNHAFLFLRVVQSEIPICWPP
jgi:bifunctional ADP-heptose synthase (sugar kinase/adenylyltransferase)